MFSSPFTPAFFPSLCSSINFGLSTEDPGPVGTFTFPSLSPFFATLTDSLQLTENAAALSPYPAALTSPVKHNPFVCHSYKKHPGRGSHPSSQVFSLCNLTTRHSRLVYPEASRRATISFRIRTSPKRARNSRRIRTSKTQDLKPFRIRTYEKRGGGGPTGCTEVPHRRNERAPGARTENATKKEVPSLSENTSFVQRWKNFTTSASRQAASWRCVFCCKYSSRRRSVPR
jgi:hypothetical protein